MFCENCGKKLTNVEKFCIECGEPVKTETAHLKESESHWFYRLGVVVYITAHLPLLIIVPVVWTENARRYSSYYKEYTGSDAEAFWYSLLTIVFYLCVLRTIKIAFFYIVKNKKPTWKDWLMF